jgi:hypothetical protein
VLRQWKSIQLFPSKPAKLFHFPSEICAGKVTDREPAPKFCENHPKKKNCIICAIREILSSDKTFEEVSHAGKSGYLRCEHIQTENTVPEGNGGTAAKIPQR